MNSVLARQRRVLPDGPLLPEQRLSVLRLRQQHERIGRGKQLRAGPLLALAPEGGAPFPSGRWLKQIVGGAYQRRRHPALVTSELPFNGRTAL